MSGSQPIPDWSNFQNNPEALNIRSGIFRCVQTKSYDVYLLDGNTELFNRKFDLFENALDFLNSSIIVKGQDSWELIIKKDVH